MLIAVYVDNQGHWIPGYRGNLMASLVSGPVNMSYDAIEITWKVFMSIGSQGMKQI
jgi:hypothetical protein